MPTKLSVPVTWDVKLSNDTLRKMLEEDKRLEPYRLIIGADYSAQLEFGCPPNTFENTAEFRRDIQDWLRLKHHLKGKELKDTSKRVSDSLVNNGMQPRPYFRPAFYYAVENMQRWWNEGYSIEEMVHKMNEQLVKNIHYNINAPYGKDMSYTGMLEESIRIEKIPNDQRDKQPEQMIPDIRNIRLEEKSRQQAKMI